MLDEKFRENLKKNRVTVKEKPYQYYVIKEVKDEGN